MKLKKLYLILFVVFGVFCFLCGFLCSNFLIRNKQNISQAQKVKYQSGLIKLSALIVSNTDLSLKIIDDILKVWRSAIEENKNFNLAIQNYLFEEKNTLNKLKYFNQEIENELSVAKDCPPKYLESHIALMDVYVVYSQFFLLAQEPIGSLLGFTNKVNNLKSEFARTLTALKIYLPQLKEIINGQQQKGNADNLKKSAQAFTLNDSLDKILKKGMKLTVVEKLIGVPKEKRRDSLNREIWVYPCEKTGFYDRVYFINEKVSEWR